MSTSRARRSGGRQFAVGGGVSVGRWRHVAVVDGVGCGCRPRRPSATRLLMSLPSFFRPSPKPAATATGPRRNTSISSGRSTHSSSSSSFFFPASGAASTASSSTTYSHEMTTTATKPPAPVPVARKRRASKTNKRREEKIMSSGLEGEEEGDVGVAVEKESSDPRGDFRDSMVQMVVEMGLCDWDGLRCMLRRLLALNAPRHHAAILAAFAEVCAHLASSAPAPPPPPPPQPPAYQYQYHHYDDYYSY